MGLQLDAIDRFVDGEMHLKDISLQFEPGQRYVLLGRTQAGKTSLLRIMAGLDRPSKGRVLVDGNDVTGVSVRRRSVAMVYQQFINYPSQTVFDNIASPLRIAGVPKAEIEKRVLEAAKMLHLEPLLSRLPAELSGGQQQRTAIARALVKEADLLLLDEPLVNLDYKLREELRDELQQIFSQRNAVVVYTTTEPSEALMLGGNVIVMHEGRVLQTGPTDEVYHHPATTKVAEVFSDPPINFITAEVDAAMAHLRIGVDFPLTGHLAGLPPGSYKFGIRPHHFNLQRKTDGDVEIRTTVELVEINGSETFVHFHYRNRSLVLQEQGVRPFKTGQEVSVFVRPCDVYVFGADDRLVRAPSLSAIDCANA
ncbi:MAG: ABC transporter ATP-binding protein [Desulfomicrobiaceae bacterium]|jgi:glycerol transport system ATP-binding protein|nr:ABC transporter ATP-binding protein [Desulfomicrobiaceae bacterium]